MNSLFSRIIVALVCAVLLRPGLASAVTLGVPVTGINSDATVGIVADGTGIDPNGTISYYIPLSEENSGVYGVDGVGTSSDSCGGWWHPNCTGGALTMYLKFSPVSTGSHIVNFLFDDLDLDIENENINDPAGFVETVEFFDSDGGAAIAYDVISADQDTQSLQILVSVAAPNDDNGFWAKLVFSSILSYELTKHHKKLRNTEEKLLATITPVPLPAALPLFGTVIAVMGFVGWRKKRRAAAVLTT